MTTCPKCGHAVEQLEPDDRWGHDEPCNVPSGGKACGCTWEGDAPATEPDLAQNYVPIFELPEMPKPTSTVCVEKEMSQVPAGLPKGRREPPPNVFAGFTIILAVLIAIVSGIIWFVGSNNPETPAGYVGYVTKGAVFGSTRFLALQTGPTSYGRTWMADVTNTSITPTKVTEAFSQGSEVLSKDQLKLTFQVHVLFKVRPDGVRDLVEKYSTLAETKKGDDPTALAFENFIREPLRTAARTEVQAFKAMDVDQNLNDISQRLTAWATRYTAGTPFDVMSVVVGNIQYPEVVSNAVALKLKADQDLQTEQTNINIEKKRAEKRVVEAQGLAEATSIIQKKLTPLYIQHEAIEAQKAMVGSPNHSTIYIPVGRNGVPLVSTVGGEQGKEVE